MKLSFHGAAKTVTGSKHLLHLDNGKKILLDCGLFQGLGRTKTEELNSSFGFEPSEIDVLILSHAHIDHSGLIPKLVKDGFVGTIFCTPATKALAAILMEDSAIIQRDDARFANKRRVKEGKPLIQPLYSVEDANKAISFLQPVEYGIWFEVLNGVKCMFTDAGHIIGSAAVHLKIDENGKTTHITFSGDVGRYGDMILKSPQTFPQADYIILESTYGNSLHQDFKPSDDVLLEWVIKTCVTKRGKLIIPAFSVGRTQELLYALNNLHNNKKLPKVPVYVDSPLSQEATQVVKSFPNYFNSKVQDILEHDKDPFDFDGLTFIQSADESKALNSKTQPCIIISASGMADAGRIKHHIANNIGKSENTILLVGYCEPNSLGGKLMNGNKEVRIFGEYFKVQAEVGIMRSMSAHGDYDDLCQFLACQNPAWINALFIVHGEEDVQVDFAKRLQKKGFKEVHVPAMHQVYILD